jgi:hypothetical protein
MQTLVTRRRETDTETQPCNKGRGTLSEHTAHILEFSFDYNNQARHLLLERRNFWFEHRDITRTNETRWDVGPTQQSSQEVYSGWRRKPSWSYQRRGNADARPGAVWARIKPKELSELPGQIA